MAYIQFHSPFQTMCGRADWCHITKMVKLEALARYKVAWRLRPTDVNLTTAGKMSVKPACRVLSRSCGIGEFVPYFTASSLRFRIYRSIVCKRSKCQVLTPSSCCLTALRRHVRHDNLPPCALETANFVEKYNALFDLFNCFGHKPSMKRPINRNNVFGILSVSLFSPQFLYFERRWASGQVCIGSPDTIINTWFIRKFLRDPTRTQSESGPKQNLISAENNQNLLMRI